MRKYVIIYLKGMAMGMADLVPGVSGGTIALVTGIYRELIESIDALSFSTIRNLRKEGVLKTWRSINGSFLMVLLLGIGTSILAFAKLFRWLLDNAFVLLWSFFFGLVLSSIYYLIKQIKRWSVTQVVVLMMASGLSFWITLLPPSSSIDTNGYLFLSGFLAIIAMILPGLSGSFILLLLGSYGVVLGAIEGLLSSLYKWNDVFYENVIRLGSLALGALMGLKLFSGILKWMFNKYEYITLSVLVGFMIGSLNKLWPWKETLQSVSVETKKIMMTQSNIFPNDYNGDSRLWMAILFALLGFSVVLILEKIALDKNKNAQRTQL